MTWVLLFGAWVLVTLVTVALCRSAGRVDHDDELEASIRRHPAGKQRPD